MYMVFLAMRRQKERREKEEIEKPFPYVYAPCIYTMPRGWI